jgi:hypothetical protein
VEGREKGGVNRLSKATKVEGKEMRKNGNPYQATGEDSTARNITKRRAVYRTSAAPTIEQDQLIEKLEKLFHGNGTGGGDPYHLMRQAEYMGIELSEEELRGDGKWYPIITEDAELSLMHRGAL